MFQKFPRKKIYQSPYNSIHQSLVLFFSDTGSNPGIFVPLFIRAGVGRSVRRSVGVVRSVDVVVARMRHHWSVRRGRVSVARVSNNSSAVSPSNRSVIANTCLAPSAMFDVTVVTRVIRIRSSNWRPAVRIVYELFYLFFVLS